MSATFVPLVPGVATAPNLSAPTRLKPIPSTSAPFEVANPAKQKPEASSLAPHVPHGQPKVTLERQGELITHIRLECPCGQVTELKCEY